MKKLLFFTLYGKFFNLNYAFGAMLSLLRSGLKSGMRSGTTPPDACDSTSDRSEFLREIRKERGKLFRYGVGCRRVLSGSN